ncbi:amidohydrolase family protein [Aestuariibius insulae]|uniref:amidohydrolase family protein n=1 Tax=Aestuariibius insulae TaxID=2058287 RepID=UPI00345E3069
MADLPVPRVPREALPEGAVDSHAHIIGSEFALAPGRAEDPPEIGLAATVAGYRAQLSALGCQRGVLVHSILYGLDNSVTVEAIRQLGPGFSGIGLVSDKADGAVLDRFPDWRLRGVRLNHVHGGVLSWEGALALAPALAERDLHIEMLLHTHAHLEAIEQDIRALATPLVIDHLGWPDLTLGVEEPGFQTLLRLLADGHVHVKLSAIYRLCDPPYDQAAPFVEALVRANPERCLWGSDWPHLMLGDARMPDAGALLDAVFDVVTDEESRQRIFAETPARLYRL